MIQGLHSQVLQLIRGRPIFLRSCFIGQLPPLLEVARGRDGGHHLCAPLLAGVFLDQLFQIHTPTTMVSSNVLPGQGTEPSLLSATPMRDEASSQEQCIHEGWNQLCTDSEHPCGLWWVPQPGTSPYSLMIMSSTDIAAEHCYYIAIDLDMAGWNLTMATGGRADHSQQAPSLHP